MNKISKDIFKNYFNKDPSNSSYAPGRVNLMGDHTDYNNGLVLPSPLSLGISLSILPSNNYKIDGISQQYGSLSRNLSNEIDGSWLDFVSGAIEVFYTHFPKNDCLLKKGIKIAVASNLPTDSGVSSSAAFSVALIKVISELENQHINPMKLAIMAQKIEHDFIGTKCGLMDQMVSSAGVKSKAMFYDVYKNYIENYPLLPGHDFLIFHSGSKRKLSESLYNKRRSECEKASFLMSVPDLRGANKELLKLLDKKLLLRASHVISENERVKNSCTALLEENADMFGEIMYDSHYSLSGNYEVSSIELDNLVKVAKDSGALGARLTGAGFGGCCVLLATRDNSEKIAEKIKKNIPNAWLVDIIN